MTDEEFEVRSRIQVRASPVLVVPIFNQNQHACHPRTKLGNDCDLSIIETEARAHET